MSASWRVYKSPPEWTTTAPAATPWTVEHRVYRMHVDFVGQREWDVYGYYPSWNNAIDAVVDAQLKDLDKIKEQEN